MKTKGNTVLITGGATGIGFALAEAFQNEGNTVLVCGRREVKLKAASTKLPGLHTVVCDVTRKKDREMMYRWVKADFAGINILINNAGVQKMINLLGGQRELQEGDDEIATNFAAPIQLAARFMPLLLKQREAAIINVTSGLGYVPIAAMPIYCATKADCIYSPFRCDIN